jgi:enoyl-CoA hydratase/carnithine racemase
MAETDVLYEKQGHIGVVTFNRPEKMNALSYEMLGLIDDITRQVREDIDVRAVVVTGAGRAFSAGTDLAELASTAPENRGNARRGAPPTDPPAPWTWASVSKPTIAAVNGAAVGLGAEFSLQCDIRIASEKARFSWVFPHRGLVPDTGAGTWLLPRVLGISKAAELLYSGDFVSAQEAKELGLVSEVTAEDQLMERAVAWATRLSSGSPLAISHIKRMLYQGLSRDPSEHNKDNVQTMDMLFKSADHKEGVASFLERRDPQWTGR